MAASHESEKDERPKGPDPQVDEAVDESFPASDPPAHSRTSATPADEEQAGEEKAKRNESKEERED